MRERADAPASASPVRAGRLATYLLLPQLVVGVYLFVVPDRLTFTLSQLMTIAHVLIALGTLPTAVIMTWRHARRMRGPASRAGGLERATKWLLGGVTAAVFATGALALTSSQGMPLSQAHAMAGLVLAIPLALHFALARRFGAAVGSLALLGVAVAGSLAVRRWVPGLSETPADPAFAYRTRPSELYDSAQWCAQCHSSIYSEWSRSIHARTLQGSQVHRNMTEQAAVLDFDLKSVGEIVKGQRHYQPGEGAHALETCTNCHVPVSFYGNDSTPVLQPGSPSNEAVTCSFCHTLRDVKLTGSMKGMFENASALRQPDAAKSLDQMPYYVSAPETVRRYLWQNAENPALRWVGNLLVRWRPEMHRRDYHVSMLDTSRTCAGCHGAGMDSPLMPVRTYPDWERSPYNTGDLRTSTQCQDCHMTTHPTGKPVREPGRVVWWGPERPQRRSHLFLGGDARVAGELGDTELAALEHELNLRAVTTRVVSASVKSGMLEVDVAVRNVMTGHLFPAFESAVRFGWVQVDALGPDGRRVAGTRTPTTNGARILDTKPGASPIIFRCVDDHLQVLCDTALKPGEERTFHAELPLPEDSRVIGVAAHVFHELDPEPIASATSSISTAG